MGHLPEGTVTFLFSDIEGSTRLLHELADGYAEVLLDHRARLRQVFARHHGVEVDTAGDSFFVAFADADDAVRAAAAVHDVLRGTPVRVRIGVHTGEPAVAGDGYVGIDVHRAARIASAAQGGQAVLSERTRTLLRGGQELKDLGLHRLKDLAAPERLHQLGTEDFPPLRSLGTTNLPAQATPLVGRLQELDDLTRLHLHRRVVTLTGPGGTGKTRLAVQAAAEVVEHFPDGVWWVPLATITEPERVLATIADALGTDRPLEEHLQGKRLLLVLDNLEQVLDAAPYLSELVRHCPDLHLLITSRAPLRLDGELEYLVDPLPEADAVALFQERAFDIGSPDAVAAICSRVDRLPLAIELAAARTRLFSPDKLLDRLERRLPMLTGGRRDAPTRHRALRDTIAWSYDLLDPDAGRLFGDLGVFVGPFDLDMAEAVCGATVDGLESLVQASLVRRDGERFTMLETIREYAVDRLELSAAAAEARDRHLGHFLALVERAEDEIAGPGVVTWMARLQQEDANIRAALAWSIRTGRQAESLRLCAAMTPFWRHVARIDEGLRWFGLAMDLGADIDDRTRASALGRWGWLLTCADRDEEGLVRAEEGVALWRAIGDEQGLAEALVGLCATLSAVDPAAARGRLDEALEVSARIGYARGEAHALHTLGELARDEGDHDAGAQLLQRSIDIAERHGWPVMMSTTMHSLADLELDRRDLDRAGDLYRQALASAGSAGIDLQTAYCLAGLAAVAALRGDAEHGAMLWAAVEHHEDVGSFRLAAGERERYERCIAGLSSWEDEPLSLAEATRRALLPSR